MAGHNVIITSSGLMSVSDSGSIMHMQLKHYDNSVSMGRMGAITKSEQPLGGLNNFRGLFLQKRNKKDRWSNKNKGLR